VIVRNYAHREIRHRSYSELQSRIEPLRFIMIMLKTSQFQRPQFRYWPTWRW